MVEDECAVFVKAFENSQVWLVRTKAERTSSLFGHQNSDALRRHSF